ncbi:IncA protein [Nocardioides dokdonensis FR1436]|uniref:IncA protein n=1 Tax=Nocardioides dokdonensis FR1436 TaxID=1300347 RepID=A0A1A9GIN7_9ACTN|nr:IncA protein [Nocardioides dokdonensis FR1436]
MATALLVLSALLVLGAVASGSALLVTVAALGAVVLGAAATRMTHAELLASRRDANRDRAEQAQAYRRLAEARADEHAARVAELTGRLGEREVALGDLQTELVKTQRTAAESARQVEVAHRRNVDLEKEGRLVSRSLESAEERAADAIVRVAELEAEIDVLRAELETVTVAWRSAEAGARRRA